jgi:hypothetical protein
MTCPHSLKSGLCSSCMGAIPRRVVLAPDGVLLDGQLARPLVTETPMQVHARRGGLARRKLKP